jgi:hypothetical protein
MGSGSDPDILRLSDIKSNLLSGIVKRSMPRYRLLGNLQLALLRIKQPDQFVLEV